MRIGTWNVEYAAGAEKNVKRMEVIRGNPADIWVLTETHDDLDLSATHRPIHSTQRPTGRPGARWVSIWTRYDVLYPIDVADPERTTAAMLHTPMGLMLVFGTVLPWHSDRGRHGDEIEVPYWSEHHREVQRQGAEWSEMRDRHKYALMCVAGDLNMNVNGPHYYGTKLGRSLLAEAMDANRLSCVTSTDRLPSGSLRYPPIDHVLVSDSLVANTSVVATWEGTQDSVRLSDHSGVVVMVREQDVEI